MPLNKLQKAPNKKIPISDNNKQKMNAWVLVKLEVGKGLVLVRFIKASKSFSII